MSMTKSTDNVTTNFPRGVSIPQITKRDVMVFNTLLLKCRGLDIIRRVQKGNKVATDPEVDVIRAFCRQALKDVKAIRMEAE